MIINSLLDNDFYLLTMLQPILYHYKGVVVKYKFHCRTSGINFLNCAEKIKQEIAALTELKFTSEELNYLKSLPGIEASLLDHLQEFSFKAEYIKISTQGEFGLEITGPWCETILYEVPLLAIINEVYMTSNQVAVSIDHAKELLQQKIDFVKSSDQANFTFIECGTRRRHSYAWQDTVINTLITQLPNHFKTTANLYFAKKIKRLPVGTWGHQFFQAMQVLAPNLRDSQKIALQLWLDYYKGERSIAMTDTYNLDAFLNDFSRDFAMVYQGVRHDSGNPYIWGEAILNHYEKMGINPASKILSFSDNLTFKTAIDLFNHFKSRVHVSCGLGTYLTNDMGVPPLNIVIKMIECNGMPVAKISDVESKTFCTSPSYLAHLKKTFLTEMENESL